MPAGPSSYRPVLLCVLDGFGYREEAPDNATTVAKMPVWRRLWQDCPHALLDTSGEDVGLPKGQMGNSEVGHMNIGAGRIVYQDLPLIDRAIASGELKSNPTLSAFIHGLQKSGGTCHLMGLASDGGVHSHTAHLLALAKILSDANVEVAVHAFLDGRDVPPQSGAHQIHGLQRELSHLKHVKLATVCGRYYAMDRDKRWDRIEKAYNLLTTGDGSRVSDFSEAVEASYADGVFDEFMLPISDRFYGGMSDGDGVLFINFRADRAREILTALLEEQFEPFERKAHIRFSAAVGMVDYSDRLCQLMTSLFPAKTIENGLGEVVSKAGLKQLRIAETEKYPHVTFFFNGGREEPYEGEDRILIPSPKVPTYDLQPEMSAEEVTSKVVEAIESGKYDLIVLNYANPDMVGHTGSLPAAVKAVETIDGCLRHLVQAIRDAGGVALITADHGNCEKMYDEATGGPYTSHTIFKVPVLLVAPEGAGMTDLRSGRLADVAPTLLELLKLPKPKEMDGESLLAS